MTKTENWEPCVALQIGDMLKWNEPLWAAPNKPRGKRDKIGEQQIIAKLMDMNDVLEFEVMSVTKLSSDDVPLSVQKHDHIKRKQSSLEKGDCCKLVE